MGFLGIGNISLNVRIRLPQDLLLIAQHGNGLLQAIGIIQISGRLTPVNVIGPVRILAALATNPTVIGSRIGLPFS